MSDDAARDLLTGAFGRIHEHVGDGLQHLGQAAYVRGIAERVTGG